MAPTGTPKPKDIRNLLLPGLWSVAEESGLSMDMLVRDGDLLVVAWKDTDYWEDDPRAVGFCITQEAIIDRTYKSEFGPNVQRLVRLRLEHS